MSVPRTGHRCSQRGQMGFELSLQIWLHDQNPAAFSACSLWSIWESHDSHVHSCSGMNLQLHLHLLTGLSCRYHPNALYIQHYTAIHTSACIVIYSHQVQPQVDKLGIFQFTSSCPEDATFDLLKGFSNPEQVVNTRPSVTRPGRPKLFVLSNVPRTLVRNLWQDETHWKPRTFLVKLAAWFELPTSKVAEIHWFWWFCPRCASMAMSSDFWPPCPDISHSACVICEVYCIKLLSTEILRWELVWNPQSQHKQKASNSRTSDYSSFTAFQCISCIYIYILYMHLLF